MTASLPMPQDSHPDSPDGDFGGARGRVTPLPPKPQTPADVAAAPGRRTGSAGEAIDQTAGQEDRPQETGAGSGAATSAAARPRHPAQAAPPPGRGRLRGAAADVVAARRSQVEAPPVEAPESPAADLPETPPAVAPEVTQAPAVETPAEPVAPSAATVASTAESSAPADVDIPPVPPTEPPPALLAPPPASEVESTGRSSPRWSPRCWSRRSWIPGPPPSSSRA